MGGGQRWKQARLEASEEAAMVMVQLKEEPGYAGETEEWSRLIDSL